MDSLCSQGDAVGVTQFVDEHGDERTIQCERCPKVCGDLVGWTVIANEQGAAVGFLCPTCQTPGEDAEADSHEVTLTYDEDEPGVIRATPEAEPPPGHSSGSESVD